MLTARPYWVIDVDCRGCLEREGGTTPPGGPCPAPRAGGPRWRWCHLPSPLPPTQELYKQSVLPQGAVDPASLQQLLMEAVKVVRALLEALQLLDVLEALEVQSACNQSMRVIGSMYLKRLRCRQSTLGSRLGGGLALATWGGALDPRGWGTATGTRFYRQRVCVLKAKIIKVSRQFFFCNMKRFDLVLFIGA